MSLCPEACDTPAPRDSPTASAGFHELECQYEIEEIARLNAALAAKDEELGVARETYQSARRSSDTGWKRAEEFKQQLAAERKSSQREREEHQAELKAMAIESEQLREQLAAERERYRKLLHDWNVLEEQLAAEQKMKWKLAEQLEEARMEAFLAKTGEK